MSPIKEPPASLSPVESLFLVEAHQRMYESKLLNPLEEGGLMSQCGWRSWARCQKKKGSGTRASWREKPARFDACSFHGKKVEHNPEIRHPIRDENGVEPAHHA